MTKPNPIEIAVAPLREDAKKRARDEARLFIAEATAELQANEWDIEKAAPYPMNIGHGFAYHLARAKYDDFHAITTSDPVKGYQALGRSSPYFVVMDDKKKQTFIDKREEQACREYDAFVAKLIKKIGPTKSATLEGNHVWSFSILYVVLENGEHQRWNTKQIVNRSVYGKLFNQWPSRKMK